MPFIDALKAVGSQLIVLHHLAFYGPMMDWTHRSWPGMVDWLSDRARIAVQVFVVVAGFLSAHSLAPDGVLRARQPWLQVWKRYLRVALPYLVALLLSVLCTDLARLWMQHDSLSAPPTLWQFLLHVLLLHGVFGVESMSAGVWYVAIDFQLYVLLLVLLWLPRRWQQLRWLGAALVVLLALASLFHFNRDSAWDVWALYFFGAYGLGVVTYWCTRPDAARLSWARWAWLCLCLAVVLALVVDFRERIALALIVALVLGWAHHGRWLAHWPRNRVIAYLGAISYSVFLLNFPVSLVVNAWFTRYMPASVAWQTLGVAVAWVACNLAGATFYHSVEKTLSWTNVRNVWIRLTQL